MGIIGRQGDPACVELIGENMQPIDYVVLAGIALLLFLALRFLWRQRGKGCRGCSGGSCCGCPYSQHTDSSESSGKIKKD